MACTVSAVANASNIAAIALPVVVETSQQYNTPAPASMLFVASEIQTIHSLHFLRDVPAGAARASIFPLPTVDALHTPPARGVH